jgi:nucleoredoxin
MADTINNKFASLEELLGDKLVKRSGDGDGEPGTIPLSSVLGATTKQILLYFSASWCPPCRAFTPKLSEAYDGYMKKIGDKEGGEAETELIFVSRDSNEEAFAKYHQQMSFPALVFDEDRSEKLMTKFGVEGIPTLVAIDMKGEVIQQQGDDDVDFRSLVGSHGADAFPLTPERILELKKEQDVKANEALKSFVNDSIVSSNGDASKTVPFKELLDKYSHVGILLGDGDVSDNCYEAASKAIEKVNNNDDNVAVVYVGWSLYNETCDHSKLAMKFDYSISVGEELSKETRQVIETVCGGTNKAGAPQLIVLRKGTGLCSIDGTCEDEDTPVLVSVDPGLFKIRQAGAAAFPWDKAAMTAHEEAEKAKVEKLKSQLKDMEFLTGTTTEEEETTGPAVVVQNQNVEDDGRSLKERLFVGDNDNDGAVVGLYFSASWCPPCVRTTPKLVKCYEELKAAGKKFEIVFVSSDSSKDEFEKYYKKMVTKCGDQQFLALDYDQRELKNRLSTLFEVEGIPTLVLLKPDGTIITKDGVKGMNVGGAAAFPWDDASIEKARTEKKAAALKAEKEGLDAQIAAGVPVVKRLVGAPGQVKHNVSERTLAFDGFSTVGVPGLQADSGTIYYELEVINSDGVPQFGFALKDGLEVSDEPSCDGVGDEATSWAVDGVRECKWHGGPAPQACSWEAGNVIGLAVNIDKGMIAVSKDGDWKKEGFGVVFNDENIKKGVYPCFTASGHEVKYCFTQGDFKYGPPDSSIWADPE